MFDTASLYELTLVAPIFHNKKPIPVEHSPKNKRANKLVSVRLITLSDIERDSTDVIMVSPKNR